MAINHIDFSFLIDAYFASKNSPIKSFFHPLQDEGELLLSKGHFEGIQCFDTLLSDTSLGQDMLQEILFKQAFFLLEFGRIQGSLSLIKKSSDRIRQLIRLQPEMGIAWYLWAINLETTSMLLYRKENILNAHKKMKEALKHLSPNLLNDYPEIYWSAASLTYRVAQLSEEMDDLSESLSYFEKASHASMPLDFWKEMGHAYLTLSHKVYSLTPALKAVSCFKKALSLVANDMECWVGAARALKKMYEISGASDYYKQASQAYSAAVEITPSVIEIWIEKLELCLNFSKDLKSCEPLYTVLNDCRRASFYFLNQATNPPSDPTSLMYARFLMVWAEILSVLGEKKDRIDFIREAENKIMEALNLSREDDSFLDMQQGKCLFSFAVFFHDVDLYYQAVEQFQKALSRKRSDAEGWFWMGRTYAALSSLTDEIDHLEKSLRFYQKSLQLKHHFRIYFEFAKMLIQKAEIDGQVEHIEQSIQYLEYLLHQNQALSYENPEWFFQYGVALDIMGQLRDETGYYKRALEALTTALMLSPQNSAIHHRIGIVYSHLGEVIDEIDYFYRSLQHLKLAAQDEEENDQIYVDWGVTWMHLSEYACDETTEKTCFAEAEQKFLFACNLGNRSAFYQLACLYSLQKEFEQSVYYLLKAHYYNTLPPLEEIQDDAWLEDVRLSHHFQEFLALLQKS